MQRRSHTQASASQLERVAYPHKERPKQWCAGGKPGRPWKVPERWAPPEVSRLRVAVAVVARMDGLLRRNTSKWTAVARLVGTRSGAVRDGVLRRLLAQHELNAAKTTIAKLSAPNGVLFDVRRRHSTALLPSVHATRLQ